MGLIALLAGLALAQEPTGPWYTGLPIAEVVLLAPEGGLPEESLQPLLRAQSGEPLSTSNVRLDIATLYRVGEFSAVEADVQQWVTYDDTGELVPAVKLAYSVYPALRVQAVHIQGNSWLKTRELASAARIESGAVFYPSLDTPGAIARVAEFARRNGFPDAVVEIDSLPSDGGLEVWIRIDEGEPQLVSEVRFAGELPVPEERLRRWARRAGIAPGRPLSPDAVQAAQYELRQHLASGGSNPWSLTRAWFKRREVGWVSARIGAVVDEGPEGSEVLYTIDPGPLLALDVRGLTWRGPQKVEAALGIDERLRLTRGFVDGASERIEGTLHRGGWRDATAMVGLIEQEGVQTLEVTVRKGPRHVLRSRLFARPNSDAHGVVFDGNTALQDWQLRTVVEQASPDVLRVGHITDHELDVGLEAVRDLYRANGYSDVAVHIDDLSVRPRASLARVPGARQLHEAMTASPPPVSVQARILVVEGEVSNLGELQLTGAAPGIDTSVITQAQQALVGAPWSPHKIRVLARNIVERHRERGYLEADARILTTQLDEHTWAAEIAVEPGQLILLRSVVTRGTRHTRPSFVRRQVDLELGTPVTSTKLDRVRNDLYDLGVFSTASTSLIGDGAARDLVVSVEERGRHALEFGPGLSTDQGLRVQARYTRRNLFRIAHRAEINALAGIAGTDSDDLEFRAAFSYTAPRFPIRSQRLVLDALLQDRQVERNYELARTGAGAFLESDLGRTNIRAGGRLEFRRLAEVDTGIVLEGEPWKDILDDPDRSWRPAHTLSALVLHDLRDDPLQPTRGGLFSLSGTFSPPIGSEVAVPFVRADAVASGFVPLRGGVRLLLSGEAGHARALSSGVIPLEDRYRLGGTASMRGFQRAAVGPRARVEQVDTGFPDTGIGPAIDHYLSDNPTRWVATGGDTLLMGTAELILPFTAMGLVTWDGWSGAVFTDVGNTFLVGSNATTTSEEAEYAAIFDPIVRYSVGAGVRIDTPVGPLRTDAAVNPERMLATGDRRELLKDQWQEPAWRLHLSIGTLF